MLVGQRAQVLGVDRGQHLTVKLRAVAQTIGIEQLAELFPRPRHEIFLVLLHHQGAEGRRHPVARIEVDLLQPPAGGLAGVQRRATGV
jgi:hypothetical protein